MKSSKTVKMNMLSKCDYHTDVVPAFVAYRKKLLHACGIKRNTNNKWNYARLFTEQRLNGARTKFWYTQKSLPTHKIASYVEKNPTFITATGRVFTVDARWVYSPMMGYRSRPDFALFCKLA